MYYKEIHEESQRSPGLFKRAKWFGCNLKQLFDDTFPKTT